ncbi:MAG: Uma2 family endonuclease [Chloroflexi bacterium]|nr:Uma2 family endonuclease [Chloroflexota bacterium]
MTTSTTPQVDQRHVIAERIRKFVQEGLNRPLSEDDPDICYPSSDGEPLAESKLQFTPLTETVHVLEHRYRDRADVFVAGNLLLYYRMNDNEVRVAPDVMVVFGVEDYPRDSYIVWREDGKIPDFVMEIASPGTYSRDVTDKRDVYAGLGVTEYWRFDPTGKLFTPALEGDRLVDAAYRPIQIAADDDGVLRGHSEVLGLDVCVRPELELRLYDPATGTWLRNLNEAEAALAESTRQNEAQTARIHELEALMRQQGIEPPGPSA